MLRVERLTCRYGDTLALDAVSLEVAPGEIAGLLGKNGAGKSTLLRTVAGLQPPGAGRIEVKGVDVWRDPTAAKRQMGYAPEEPSFYEELSADEYLAFLSGVRGLDPAAARERARELCERLGLEGRTDEPVRRFSHGMRKKLSFIAATLHRPAVLLCDEALEGFDASAAFEAKAELRALAAGGAAILFSSHVTETLERLCQRTVILHRGRLARVVTCAGPSAGTAYSPLEREFLEVAGTLTHGASR